MRKISLKDEIAIGQGLTQRIEREKNIREYDWFDQEHDFDKVGMRNKCRAIIDNNY